jgi:hypothetical protein
VLYLFWLLLCATLRKVSRPVAYGKSPHMGVLVIPTRSPRDTSPLRIVKLFHARRPRTSALRSPSPHTRSMSSLVLPTILRLSLSPPLLSSPPLRCIAMKPLSLLPVWQRRRSTRSYFRCNLTSVHSVGFHTAPSSALVPAFYSSYAPFGCRFPFIFPPLYMFSLRP